MKLQAILATVVLAATVQAETLSKRALVPRELSGRQSSGCPSSYKACGDVCIQSSYTCCPDQQGGCPSTENCQLGANKEYGCCPKGKSCSGDGGVDTSLIGGEASTTSFRAGVTTTRRSTTTANDDLPTTRNSSPATPTSNAQGGSTGGPNAAGHTYGTVSYALLCGGSIAAAGLALAAAIAL